MNAGFLRKSLSMTSSRHAMSSSVPPPERNEYEGYEDRVQANHTPERVARKENPAVGSDSMAGWSGGHGTRVRPRP